MLGFGGPAQPSPALGDAINGYGYLEVRRLGCDTHQTVALDIVRRPRTTPVDELERYIRCKDCSGARPSLQAQPSGCLAGDQDNGERSAVALAAGRTMTTLVKRKRINYGHRQKAALFCDNIAPNHGASGRFAD